VDETFTFIATSSQSTLEFISTTTENPSDLGFSPCGAALDNVTVSTENPVPVPPTVLLLGSGLLGLLGLRRIRKR
jgi:hypothetical protein